MSARSYLSIGDVLSLLRREFPDVTISKIRFLESQGLVDPERTPSGYRKFYDQDVERLRWVLRQQREHFLPLKVIKGRLEEESSSPGENGHDLQRSARERVTSESSQAGAGAGLVSDERGAGVLLADRAAAQRRATSVAAAPGAGAPEAPDGAAPRLADRKAPKGQELPGLTDEETGEEDPALPGAPSSSKTPPVPPPARARAERVRPLVPAEEPGPRSAKADGGGAAKGGGPAEQVRHAPAPHAAEKPPRRGATAPGATLRGSTPGISQLGAFSGTSMTVEELAQAGGLGPADVQQLESFGLISGRVAGGVSYYDEDALIVTRLASSFAQFGVEARHLRLHLLAAQREAGFVEQIVLPLLKQRNPASRQRAHETVSELSRLGQELRSVLLQKGLRELLGG